MIMVDHPGVVSLSELSELVDANSVTDILARLTSDTLSSRIPLFEQLLNWTSTVYLHGLEKGELSRIVKLIMGAFQTVSLVYVEDWQAVFDCYDILLYRLKSAGQPYTDLFWNTLLTLAGRLALDKVAPNQPELSTRILRPLYTSSSILINLHGPEGLMDQCKSSPHCTAKNPLLLELSLKFLIRALLFFPQYTLPTLKTTRFFIQTALDHPISIIRRAALEGIRVLRVVKVAESKVIVDAIQKLLCRKEDSEARAAFLFSVDQPTTAKTDYSSQTIQMWIDVRDRGQGPDLPADIAWIALAGDEFLPLCVRDGTFWTPITGLKKASPLRTHKLPMAEAGDAIDPLLATNHDESAASRSSPVLTNSTTTDQGAGDRPVRKKRPAPVPSITGSSNSGTMTKLTSNVSLSTYNVEDIPVIPALDSRACVNLTGWVEKEETGTMDIDRNGPSTNRLSTGTIILEKSDPESTRKDLITKPAKKRTTRVHGKSKPKKPLDVETVESAQDFYIGSGSPPASVDELQKLPSGLTPNDEVPSHLPVPKTRKSRRLKDDVPQIPSTAVDSSTPCPAQTIRLSKAPPQLQLHYALLANDEVPHAVGRPLSAISRQAVDRKKSSKGQEETSTVHPLIPQAKLIRKLPDTDDRHLDESPALEEPPRKERITNILKRCKESSASLPLPPLPPSTVMLGYRNLETARVHSSSEFDSGMGLSTELSPSSRPISRKHPRECESARMEVAITESNVEDYRPPPTKPFRNGEESDNNCSIDRSSMSGPGGQQIAQSAVHHSPAEMPKGKKFFRQQPASSEEPALKARRNSVSKVETEKCFRMKPLSESRNDSTTPLLFGGIAGSSINATSKESGLESINDEMATQAVKPLKRFNRLVESEGSEGAMDGALAKKTEEVRLDLQGLLDRMQKGPRYSSDILQAIEEFVQLSKAFPRVLENAIGAAFSQYLPLIYNLNSHVAAEAVAGLEIVMPLVERRIHLVAPQIVEALSNNMQNARTCDHSKKVFNQILNMQVDRAGTLLAPLSSHITTVMKKNKKEAFAFITCKYAETLGHAFPKPPKSQAAAVQILQFVKSVLVWITNYGDLDSSTKPEILAVDALIQQAIRSFGLEMVNKVCYDYRDTIKIFLTRKDSGAEPAPKSGGMKLLRLVTRKSNLMAFKKKIK